MAVLPVQKPGLVGINPTLTAAAAGGDSFVNDGKTLFYVKNAHTAPITITVNSLKACDQGFDHNIVIAVPNAATVQIGPFPTSRFNDPTGKVGVTYSVVTALTVAPVSLA